MNVSEKLMYIVGKWLANGWTFNGKVYIESWRDEKLEEALYYRPESWERRLKGMHRLYIITSKELADWLDSEFGKGENKHIPEWALVYKAILSEALGKKAKIFFGGKRCTRP